MSEWQDESGSFWAVWAFTGQSERFQFHSCHAVFACGLMLKTSPDIQLVFRALVTFSWCSLGRSYNLPGSLGVMSQVCHSLLQILSTSVRLRRGQIADGRFLSILWAGLSTDVCRCFAGRWTFSPSPDLCNSYLDAFTSTHTGSAELDWPRGSVIILFCSILSSTQTWKIHQPSESKWCFRTLFKKEKKNGKESIHKTASLGFCGPHHGTWCATTEHLAWCLRGCCHINGP